MAGCKSGAVCEGLNGIWLPKALLEKQQGQGRLRELPKPCSKAILGAGSVPRAPEAWKWLEGWFGGGFGSWPGAEPA